jgi:hypothetical protein
MCTVSAGSTTTTDASAHADEPAREVRRCTGRRTTLIAILLGLLSTLILAAPAADAADLGGVSVVATGSYSCSSQTVQILPTTNEPLTGDYTVYAYASVWEDGRGWVTGPWGNVDGITTLMFYDVTSQPSDWAQLTYARYYDGAWHYATDWIQLSNDLDNFAPFC